MAAAARPRRGRRDRSPAGEAWRNTEVGASLLTAGCSVDCADSGEVGGGVPAPPRRLSPAAPAPADRKGERLPRRAPQRRVRPGVPAQGSRDGARWDFASNPAALHFSEPPPPRHSPSCGRPPPLQRLVTLRATVPGTLSPRPGRVTPLIPGFSPTGAPRAESGAGVGPRLGLVD